MWCPLANDDPPSQYLTQLFTEKRAIEGVAISATAKAFETIGLSMFLTWWGTRTNPFD